MAVFSPAAQAGLHNGDIRGGGCRLNIDVKAQLRNFFIKLQIAHLSVNKAVAMVFTGEVPQHPLVGI